MSKYSNDIKDKITLKLLQPGASVLQLSKETGISKTLLYKWKNRAISTNGDNMSDCKDKKIRPQNWSAENKLQAIIDTANMTDEEIGVYCRSKGIYSKNITNWKSMLINNMKPSAIKERQLENTKLKTEVKSLKKELTRKEKALAEASTLLMIQKKMQSIWGDAQED